jgi:signal transduction histidine kinase
MSHELRTPLTAIISYAEVLQQRASALGQAAFLPDLQRVGAAARHLLGLVDDLLDLSRIEAGRLDLYLEWFEIGQVVREVGAIVQPLIERNGNTLVVVCPGDIGVMHADLAKLRQTLFNVLANAARFTDDGTITLRVDRSQEREGSAQQPTSSITFAVSDTGVGMTADQLAHVFQAFSPSELTRSRSAGTGLGLAISRHFCRMMGGDLTATSSYGHGSTFTVRLPDIAPEPAS